MNTTTSGAAPTGQREILIVFGGLMLGMFIAALSQTIVAPAMPRIVAELGGIDRYSWVAVASLLATAVVAPIAGKLSDLFGRKQFYVGGIVTFLGGSVIAGLTPSFNVLILARAIQGLGMGTMMALSQAIIGDLIPPRERGRYQGLMGASFGIASVSGPLLGGYITDNFSWRLLFFVNLPFGLAALAIILPYMRVPHIRREQRIDYAGFATLSSGLVLTLLATAWGGSEYPWGSSQIVGLYLIGGLFLLTFIAVERRAAEPVIPLRLWKSSIFTFSNLAGMAVGMAMFGAIYFIPVFVQGVVGNDATNSGAILIPMNLSMIMMSILTGQLITRTGRYKALILVGILLMGLGFFLLTRMGAGTTNGVVIRNMIVTGLGLGMCMQTFVLVVQNAARREDLGVVTATSQLFRSIGSTLGVSILGTVLTQSMSSEIPSRVSPEQAAQLGTISAGSVLDPAQLATLPPEAVIAVREGLAASLQNVFMMGLPFLALALVSAILIREIPLRRSLSHDDEPGAASPPAQPVDASDTGERRETRSPREATLATQRASETRE